MKLNYTSYNNDTKLIVLFTFLFIANALAVSNVRIGIALCAFEMVILLYYFIKGSIENYVLCYILFLVTSIEVSQFALGFESGSGIVYNFMRLPVVNMDHFYLLTLLPLVLIARENKFMTYLKNIRGLKNTKKLMRMLFLFMIIGLLSAFVCILFNDNKATSYAFFWLLLLQDILAFGMLFFVAFYLTYLIANRKGFCEKLERLLTCILISIVPSALITVVFGMRGYYGRSTDSEVVLLLPLVAFFGVMLIIFPFYKQYQSTKRWFVYGLILLVVMIAYPSPLGGKWWLIVLGLPVIIVYSYIKNMTIKKLLTVYSLIIILSVLIWVIISMTDTMGFGNAMTENKFTQATQTLFFWEEDWYDNLSVSPKFRFDEFINIIYEYLETPQYLFFGKGFGGSTTLHTTTLNWNVESAFSIDQIQAGLFIRLHESANVIFLKFGLLGLFFFIKILFICFKNIGHNPWIVIGMIWFFFYFSIYLSLYFGLCSLVIGFYKVDIETRKTMEWFTNPISR